MNRLYNDQKPRLKNWDYSKPGQYFITIVSYNRHCLFGWIRNRKTELSELGKIVAEEWLKSFEMRSELFCDSWVIMPNHIHAIVQIDRQKNTGKTVERKNSPAGELFRPPKSIPSFVAGFKAAATRRINLHRKTPGLKVWQDRYYDHIIRDIPGYEKIRNYIENNPASWHDDVFHPFK
jgi:putative transposase